MHASVYFVHDNRCSGFRPEVHFVKSFMSVANIYLTKTDYHSLNILIIINSYDGFGNYKQQNINC